MAKEHFIKLIEDFCSLSNLDRPERILHGGPVLVNDVVFSLVHSERVDPALLFIYADFGPLPPKQETEVCKALLEANLFLYTGTGPAFTLSPETKNVTFAHHRMLDKITAEELRDTLVNLSAQAKNWRKTYFLDLNPEAPRSQRGAFHSLHLRLKE